MSDPAGDKPKIIIDEDWKSRVEAERTQAEQKPAAEQPPAQAASMPPPKASPQQLPPPTLPVLVTTLATQAMVFLGQIPSPISGKSEVALPEAQHFIDSIAMLQEKTAGNRTADEDRLLETLLHELRMAYLHVATQQAGQAS